MAERPVILDGRNLALVCLDAVLVIAALLLWIGPGQSELARVRAEVHELEKRAETAEKRIASSAPARADEVQRWSNDFEALTSHGFAHDDEAALVGRTASWLGSHGLRGLDITAANAATDDHEPGIVIPAADGSARELRAVAMNARFETNYAELARMLTRLSDPRAPIDLRRIEVRRHYPRVKVDLQLALWTHAQVSQ